MEIKKVPFEGFQMYNIRGELRDEDEKDFINQIGKDISPDNCKIILNMNWVISMSSHAIGFIVTIWKKVIQLNGHMIIISNRDHLNAIFEATNLQKLLNIVATEQDAREKIKKGNSFTPRVRTLDKFKVIDANEPVDVMTDAESLDKAIAGLAHNGSKWIVINMNNVMYVYSSVLGVLVKWAKELGKKGGELCLVGLGNQLHERLEESDLDKTISFYRNERDLPILKTAKNY